MGTSPHRGKRTRRKIASEKYEGARGRGRPVPSLVYDALRAGIGGPCRPLLFLETVNNSKVGLVPLSQSPFFSSTSASLLDLGKGWEFQNKPNEAAHDDDRNAAEAQNGRASPPECKYGNRGRDAPQRFADRVYSAAERLFMLGRGNRAEWGREEGNEGKEDGRIPHPPLSPSLFPFSLSFFTLSNLFRLPPLPSPSLTLLH